MPVKKLQARLLFSVSPLIPLCDVKGPLEYPGLPPFVLTAAFLGLAGAVTIAVRYRSQRPAPAPIVMVPENPKDLLAETERKFDNSQVTEEQLFAELTNALGLALLGPLYRNSMTTAEIIRCAEQQKLFRETEYMEAYRLLQLCDRVKFARFTPERSATKQTLKDAASLTELLAGGTA